MVANPKFDPKLPTTDDVVLLLEGQLELILDPNKLDAFIFGWQIGGVLHRTLMEYEDLLTEEREQEILKMYAVTPEQPVSNVQIQIAQEFPQPILRIKPEQILNPDNSGVATVNQIKIPELPESEYPRLEPNTPKANSTNTEATYSVEIAESFKNHTFGCLICKPYTNKAIEFLVPDLPNIGEFYSNLEKESREEFAEYQEKLSKTPPETQRNSAAEAIYQILMPYHNNSFYIRGTKAIDQIATYDHALAKFIENYPLVGLLSTQAPTIETYEIPRYNVEARYYNLAGESAECAIPMNLYADHNLSLRKASQLSIIWRNEDYQENKKPKQTSFPSPKDPKELNEDLFKSVLPKNRVFGERMIQIIYEDQDPFDTSLRLASHFLFTDKIDKSDIEDLMTNQVAKWIENFCQPSLTIKDYNDRSFKQVPVYTGNYYPYKAIYQTWEEDTKKFVTKYSWYIYTTNPNV